MKSTKKGTGTGPGKGSTYVSTTITLEVDAELRRLADVSHITRTAMARECINDAVARGLTITRSTSHAGKIVDLPANTPPAGGHRARR
jgi:hypothetical protein